LNLEYKKIEGVPTKTQPKQGKNRHVSIQKHLDALGMGHVQYNALFVDAVFTKEATLLVHDMFVFLFLFYFSFACRQNEPTRMNYMHIDLEMKRSCGMG
jgi:hypothetical protein